MIVIQKKESVLGNHPEFPALSRRHNKGGCVITRRAGKMEAVMG